MLLKKILQNTSASPNVVFYDPFQDVDTDNIIQHVIGLANLDFEGPRYVVFGVNKAAMQGNGVVGWWQVSKALNMGHAPMSCAIKFV